MKCEYGLGSSVEERGVDSTKKDRINNRYKSQQIQIRNILMHYNYYMSEMNKNNRMEEANNNSQFQKSRAGPQSQHTDLGQLFNVELTVSQANAILRLLPKGYSIHIDRAIKTKRAVKRKFTLENKNYKSLYEGSQDIQNNQMAEQPANDPIQTMNYDDMVSRCQKILNLLRKNKNSWPFKQPVDPITMCIPHYLQIITNPMDLRTVGQNLSSHKYSTMSQFYGDIHLIIRNSYTFNKNNPQFCQITADFQKYFEKIKSEPVMVSKPQTLMMKKSSTKSGGFQKKQNEVKSMSQLAQRKQLAMKLKYLPKQQLVSLIHAMNDMGQRTSELNLQILPIDKIRYLQDYIHKKENEAKTKDDNKKSLGDQSSFQSDSDS